MAKDFHNKLHTFIKIFLALLLGIFIVLGAYFGISRFLQKDPLTHFKAEGVQMGMEIHLNTQAQVQWQKYFHDVVMKDNFFASIFPGMDPNVVIPFLGEYVAEKISIVVYEDQYFIAFYPKHVEQTQTLLEIFTPSLMAQRLDDGAYILYNSGLSNYQDYLVKEKGKTAKDVLMWQGYVPESMLSISTTDALRPAELLTLFHGEANVGYGILFNTFLSPFTSTYTNVFYTEDQALRLVSKAGIEKNAMKDFVHSDMLDVHLLSYLPDTTTSFVSFYYKDSFLTAVEGFLRNYVHVNASVLLSNVVERLVQEHLLLDNIQELQELLEETTVVVAETDKEGEVIVLLKKPTKESFGTMVERYGEKLKEHFALEEIEVKLPDSTRGVMLRENPDLLRTDVMTSTGSTMTTMHIGDTFLMQFVEKDDVVRIANTPAEAYEPIDTSVINTYFAKQYQGLISLPMTAQQLASFIGPFGGTDLTEQEGRLDVGYKQFDDGIVIQTIITFHTPEEVLPAEEEETQPSDIEDSEETTSTENT